VKQAGLLLAIALGLAPACRRDPPPPDVHVALEVEGGPASVIDRARLDRTPPDFHVGSRRVWRLRSLLGEAHAGRQMQIEVEHGAGETTRFPGSDAAGGREPMVSLDGSDLRLAFSRADAPFPEKDAVGPVRRIRFVLVDAGASAAGNASGAPAELAADLRVEVIGGAAPAVWTRAELGRVKMVAFSTDDGKEQRDAWSVRDLAKELLEEGVEVVEVVGDGGRRVPVTRAMWRDPARVPVLRVTHRGLVKFQWLSAGALERIEGDDLRGVTAIRIAKAGG
jgi:hypothetical protein